MEIADYVKEIELAAGAIFPVVWAEQKRLIELTEEVKRLENAVEHGYQRAEAWQQSDDPDDVALGAGIYWQTYFEEDKERCYKDDERQRLKELCAIRRFSVDSLAGSILQFGKQAISIAYTTPDKCPKDGRLIGSQRLPDVIWHGRNQALHWEEGEFRPKTKACFEKLAKEVCKSFAEYEKRNHGFHLIYHLGWTDFEKFKADLLSLE